MDVNSDQVLPALQRRIAEDALTIAVLRVQVDLLSIENTQLKEQAPAAEVATTAPS